jgi:hypothetical protein
MAGSHLAFLQCLFTGILGKTSEVVNLENIFNDIYLPFSLLFILWSRRTKLQL